MTLTDASSPPTARPQARSWAKPLLTVVVLAVAGVAWGLLWWRLAPTAHTTVSDGSIYLNGHDELNVQQDGWFVILGAVTGGVLAVVLPVVTRALPIWGFVVGLVGCVASGLLAWWLGGELGPAGLREQYHAGVKAPITPIELHSPTVVALLVAPFLFAVVRFVTELLSSVLAGRADHAESERPARPAPSAAQGVDVEQGQ